MSDENLRQLRVLHIVSSGGVCGSLNQSLFMPLLTRMPKSRVKAQLVCLSPGAAPADVLRQHGVPVHDAPLSRKRFALHGFTDTLKAARQFRPDVIQSWGHTAHLVASLVRSRCEWRPKLVWSVAQTAPLARNAGLIDRRKLKFAARAAAKADRIVYTSEAGASQHRRAGFPDGGHLTISPGVDAARFKPDPEARRKLREQLSLPPKAFVVGMVAPFQPESDYATLLKALQELFKTNPELTVVLAGRGVQKGNAALMALVGGAAFGARVHLLGEVSDAASLFNACDVVCLSTLTDSSRMTLAMAMLCGAPCVATGMGAQGEVIGQHGVALEPGSPAAFIKGVARIMQLTPERHAQMIQGARKHVLKEYVYVRSLQKYLQLYFDLIGRDSLASDVVVAPAIDVGTPAPDAVAEQTPAEPKKLKEQAAEESPEARTTHKPQVTARRAEIAGPAALDVKVPDEPPVAPPQQQDDQGRKAAEMDAAPTPAAQMHGDVLEIFESGLALEAASEPAVSRVASQHADEIEDLIAPEALESDAPAKTRAPTPQARAAGGDAADADRPDAAQRMRAAARLELQRAAAAMSAPSRPASSSEAPKADAPTGEFQLELAPDEPPAGNGRAANG